MAGGLATVLGQLDSSRIQGGNLRWYMYVVHTMPLTKQTCYVMASTASARACGVNTLTPPQTLDHQPIAVIACHSHRPAQAAHMGVYV